VSEAAWPLIVAATAPEARAVRRVLPSAEVIQSGMSLADLPRERWPRTGAVVTVGVAGALRAGLPTGTVVVPTRVLRPSGAVVECDPALVEALGAAARCLGHEPDLGTMATTPGLVVGAERAEWAARGCASADMETGLLEADRIASVRVVLDTPERELHLAWRRPITVLWHPAAWPQLPWLAVEAPRCARLAAEVLAEALSPGGRQ
jgi:4-hydroxy-3-methylbut-2-enyl diphosphate reductase